jgi:hypothetical protein
MAVKKGQKMENQIICPACKRTITNNPVVDAAAKGEDQVLGSEYVICECGERISFWEITAQLRDQKKPVDKILKWFHSLSKG